MTSEKGVGGLKARVAAVGVLVLLASLAVGCQTEPTPAEKDPKGTKKHPVELTFLAYGPKEEVAAMTSTVEKFNKENPTVEVTLEAAKDEDQVLRRLQGKNPPDVYQLSQRDLADVYEQKLNSPLDEYLDSRGVDFGDLYKRDSNLAFAIDSELQCMPWGISPMVIYYNTSLIDFEAMRDQDLDAPSDPLQWTFDEFAAAAEFASKRRGVKGVYIEPSLEGIAPFVYSGGGKLFDDNQDPTQLTLSDEDSLEPLTQLMDLLRNDKITLSARQIRKEPALERFKKGKLGMIAGYRRLVPELRGTPSLNFDVMPMPALDNETTIGDVSGLCMSSKPRSYSAAADFIVHMISTESVSEVAKAGYLVPSNNEVAESDAFLQRDALPAHAEVFNRSVRDIQLLPLLDSWEGLEDAVHDPIYKLFYARVFDDGIEGVAEQIDEDSEPILDPEDDSTDGPTDGASAGGADASASPSGG